MLVAFDIEPSVGALPVRFGMHRDEVHALLGKPDVSRPVRCNTGIADYWRRSPVNVRYDTGGAVQHVGFVPGGFNLSLRGLRLWSLMEQPDPNPVLLRLDPTPLDCLGILVFPALGISTSGYHDDDDAQRSVTISSTGTWDKALQTGRRPNLEKYRIT
jgi:hypothetical protein